MVAADCVAHQECRSGFCDKGVCKQGSHVGDPCAANRCGGGLTCHPVLRRCLIAGTKYSPFDFCHRDADCPLSQYCASGKCTPRQQLRNMCSPDGSCGDGQICVNQQSCHNLCKSQLDCEHSDCIKVDPSGVMVCKEKADSSLNKWASEIQENPIVSTTLTLQSSPSISAISLIIILLGLGCLIAWKRARTS